MNDNNMNDSTDSDNNNMNDNMNDSDNNNMNDNTDSDSNYTSPPPPPILKCGPRRAKFLLECVADLRLQLEQQCHSQLIVGYDTTVPQFFHTLLTDLKDYYRRRHRDEKKLYRRIRRSSSRRAFVPEDDNDDDDDDDDDHHHHCDGHDDLQFDITIVCQDEPVREERMQVFHVSKVLQYHNNSNNNRNNNNNKNSNSNTTTTHPDAPSETYDTALWDRVNREGHLAASYSKASSFSSSTKTPPPPLVTYPRPPLRGNCIVGLSCHFLYNCIDSCPVGER